RTAAEERETTLDGRALYAHAKTASYLYQASLRRELTKRLGVAWTPVDQGIAEIVGIDAEVREHFSRRRAEIVERLRERGGRTARAAQIATLETRRSKDYDVPVARIRDEWRARAEELGLGRAELCQLARMAPRRERVDVGATADWLAASEGLTAHASAF